MCKSLEGVIKFNDVNKYTKYIGGVALTIDDETQKKCSKCSRVLPIDNFAFRNDSKKYRNECKECQSKKYAEWREKNKFYHNEYCKKYYEENKASMREHNKKYYEENKENIKTQSKLYRKENADKLSEQKKQYRKENAEKLKEYEKARYIKNKEYYKERNRKYAEEHKEKMREYGKKWREQNPDKYEEYHKQYREENNEVIKEKRRAWAQTYSGRLASVRHKQKRRSLGFSPINEKFENSEFHHLHVDFEGNPDNAIGLFIPAELHKSVPHNPKTWKGMDEINSMAITWYREVAANEQTNN